MTGIKERHAAQGRKEKGGERRWQVLSAISRLLEWRRKTIGLVVPECVLDFLTDQLADATDDKKLDREAVRQKKIEDLKDEGRWIEEKDLARVQRTIEGKLHARMKARPPTTRQRAFDFLKLLVVVLLCGEAPASRGATFIHLRTSHLTLIENCYQVEIPAGELGIKGKFVALEYPIPAWATAFITYYLRVVLPILTASMLQTDKRGALVFPTLSGKQRSDLDFFADVLVENGAPAKCTAHYMRHIQHTGARAAKVDEDTNLALCMARDQLPTTADQYYLKHNRASARGRKLLLGYFDQKRKRRAGNRGELPKKKKQKTNLQFPRFCGCGLTDSNRSRHTRHSRHQQWLADGNE